MAQTLHPPSVALQGVAIPGNPCRGSFRSFQCVAGASQLHPHQRSLSHPILYPPCSNYLGTVESISDLRNPVALQGVEQLHLRASRYTLTLRSSTQRDLGVVVHRWAGNKATVKAKCWYGLANQGSSIVNSVRTRCIVKTSGFTRGVCNNRGFC